MKRYLQWVLGWVVAAGLVTALTAQPPDTGKGRAGRPMADSTAMGCPMHGKPMGLEVIPLSDGGIIVVSGNRLSKYDKDLTLKKEITIPLDSLSMQRMKSCCPMMRQGQKP